MYSSIMSSRSSLCRENLVLFCVTLIALLHPVVGQTCSSTGVIGDDRPQGSSSDINNFYLNVNSPASCGGMITGFNYSFFAPITGPQVTTSYTTVFAVYRQTGTMNNMPVYSVVSESYLITVPRSQITSGAFRSSYLPLSSPVSVEAGDLLGACVNDPPGEDTYRLDIVGTSPSSNDKLLVSASGCGAQSVPSSITNSLNQQVAILLHLYANIEPFSVNLITTTSGNSSLQTTPKTVDETTNRDVFSSQGVTAVVVIIVIIFLLALAGMVVVVVIMLIRRRVPARRKSDDISKKKGGHADLRLPERNEDTSGYTSTRVNAPSVNLMSNNAAYSIHAHGDPLTGPTTSSAIGGVCHNTSVTNASHLTAGDRRAQTEFATGANEAYYIDPKANGGRKVELPVDHEYEYID